jgi:hypothetical protein
MTGFGHCRSNAICLGKILCSELTLRDVLVCVGPCFPRFLSALEGIGGLSFLCGSFGLVGLSERICAFRQSASFNEMKMEKAEVQSILVLMIQSGSHIPLAL